MDVYEGYPRLYEKEDITVRTGDGKDVTVMAYIMTGELWRDPAIPSPPTMAAFWRDTAKTACRCRNWRPR